MLPVPGSREQGGASATGRDPLLEMPGERSETERDKAFRVQLDERLADLLAHEAKISGGRYDFQDLEAKRGFDIGECQRRHQRCAIDYYGAGDRRHLLLDSGKHLLGRGEANWFPIGNEAKIVALGQDAFIGGIDRGRQIHHDEVG